MNQLRTIVRRSSNFVIATLFLSVTVAAAVPKSVSATPVTMPTITGGANVSGFTNQSISIDDISINGTGTVPVLLTVGQGILSMSTTTGLTFTGDTTGPRLSFSGTVANVNTALATLSYTVSEPTETTLDVSLSGQQQVSYGGHMYEVVSTNCDGESGEGCISWNSAKTAAEARTYLGASGYLASITSEEENLYLASHLTGGAAWMGATDGAAEGTWKWSGGPDDGHEFWSGDAYGTTVDGSYANWNENEPNDSEGGEDCGQMYAGDSTGKWNDLPCNSDILGSYLVEYGTGNDDFSSVPTDSLDITVTPETGEDLEINDCQELQSIEELSSTFAAMYTLGNNIDCTMTNPQSANFDPEGPWADGLGFRPLGAGPAFSGEFDGQGYTIDGLFINREEMSGVGLFSEADGYSYLHDVAFRNANITGYGDVGTLAGEAYGDIHKVDVSTDITGYGSHVAGLVGYADGSDVTDVHVDGTVFADHEEGGGIIGQYDGGILADCSFSGTIDSYYESGGIIGENEGSVTILRCFSEGSITADDTDTGGLVGEVEDDIVIDHAFSTMDVMGDDVGGLIGTIYGNTEVYNSFFNGTVGDAGDAGLAVGHISSSEEVFFYDTYVTGTVESVDTVGGFIGDPGDNSDFINTYWNTQSSGQNDACGDDGDCGDLVGKTTDELTNIQTFTSELGEDSWDFEDIWFIDPAVNDGYPCLKWASNFCAGDYDGDGVKDVLENAGPNNGDGNNDGVPDRKQDHVVPVTSAVSGKQAVLEVSSECVVSSASSVAESSSVTDAGYNYPNGLMHFRAECGTPGVTITAKQFYYNVAKDNVVLRKFNSTTGAYSSLTGTITQQTITGATVTTAIYSLTDGSPNDEDATANGVIVDPAGLGLLVAGAPNTGIARQAK